MHSRRALRHVEHVGAVLSHLTFRRAHVTQVNGMLVAALSDSGGVALLFWEGAMAIGRGCDGVDEADDILAY